MFGKKFQRKYALTDQGVQNTKKGAFWTVIVNLVVMGGVSVLYLMMSGFMDTLTDGSPLPGAWLPIALTVLFAVLSFVTHLQQYRATYGLVYGEVKATRLRLAERLRKLPLGYFGKRDLADLTETLMGDVNRMEHVWSHVLGYLYGAYISTETHFRAPAWKRTCPAARFRWNGWCAPYPSPPNRWRQTRGNRAAPRRIAPRGAWRPHPGDTSHAHAYCAKSRWHARR